MPTTPPEILGHLTSPHEQGAQFANDFCRIGDQNGDGYDDLLISENRWPADSASAVYLYYGGEEIDNDPDFIISQYEENRIIGAALAYFGLLLGENHPHYFGISSFIRQQESPFGINFHAISEDLNIQPNFTLYSIENYPKINNGYLNRPCDFNGDGFGDVVVPRHDIGLHVFFGGEEFDTIVDWSIPIRSWYYSSGLDINGDGYGEHTNVYGRQLHNLPRWRRA